MKLKIEPSSIDYEEMKAKLEANFPNYGFKTRKGVKIFFSPSSFL